MFMSFKFQSLSILHPQIWDACQYENLLTITATIVAISNSNVCPSNEGVHTAFKTDIAIAGVFLDFETHLCMHS